MVEISYEQIEADKFLTDFVKRFWKFTNPTNNIQQYTILPDGYFDLILQFDRERLTSIHLFGLWTKELEVVLSANTVIVGICFKPLAAEYILKQSIADQLNSFITLDNRFWNIKYPKDERFDEWVKDLEAKMISELQNTGELDSRKQTLFRLLFDSGGSSSVENLSKRTFWSARQINRYFKNNFGFSLKVYSAILRCASTYTDIRNGELYPNKDFYDQAHFIKEVKKFTGFRPKELYQNKNDRFLQFSTLP